MSGWRRLLLYPALLSVGAGMLVSCAGDHLPPSRETAAVQLPQQPAPQVPPFPHPAPRPARKPTPPPAVEGATPDGRDQALTMIEPEPTTHPPGPTVAAPVQVQELIGLDQAAATRLLGIAAERTEEPPATVWRYKTATCELDLFFYLDLRSGRMRTLHYTFKGEADDAARRQNCLKELVGTRRS
jgi:hypothetical protein